LTCRSLSTIELVQDDIILEEEEKKSDDHQDKICEINRVYEDKIKVLEARFLKTNDKNG